MFPLLLALSHAFLSHALELQSRLFCSKHSSWHNHCTRYPQSAADTTIVVSVCSALHAQCWYVIKSYQLPSLYTSCVLQCIVLQHVCFHNVPEEPLANMAQSLYVTVELCKPLTRHSEDGIKWRRAWERLAVEYGVVIQDIHCELIQRPSSRVRPARRWQKAWHAKQ